MSMSFPDSQLELEEGAGVGSGRSSERLGSASSRDLFRPAPEGLEGVMLAFANRRAKAAWLGLVWKVDFPSVKAWCAVCGARARTGPSAKELPK